MQPLHSLILLALIFCFSSCIEVIDFETVRSGGQLVVDGRITAGPGPYTLKLGETASINRKTFPVEGAQVVLFDGQGQSEFYTEIGEGVYELPGNIIQGKAGESYFISITLSNGKVYQSDPEVLPAPAGIQTVMNYDLGIEEEINSFGLELSKPVINVYVDVEFDSERTTNFFLRWDIEEVYNLNPTFFPCGLCQPPPTCYISQFPSTQNFTLFEGLNIQNSQLTNQKVATQIIDFTFNEKHYFNSYMVSMSERNYTYWSQINQLTDNIGTIFDAPPAAVEGNIFNPENPEEQVLGYFEAVSIDTLRRAFSGEDVGLINRIDCTYAIWRNDYPERCLDCTIIPNVSFIRPDYF